MNGTVGGFFLSFLQFVLTLPGIFLICGLVMYLLSWLYARLLRGDAEGMVDITSFVGSPIHELGHAAMCRIFAHKITKLCLWTPRPENGVYGYVEHNYSKRNPWARLGNLFIGVGPLLSGLGVVVVVLWLCFPPLWKDYLLTSKEIMNTQEPLRVILSTLGSVFRGLWTSLREDWLKSLLGLLILLPLSAHLYISPKTIGKSLGALIVMLLVSLLLTLVTFWTPAAGPIVRGLGLFHLRVVSLFALMAGLSLIWVVFAGIWALVRLLIRSF